MQITFDREKYLKLAQTQGYSAALTALHHDINAWEQVTFEGTAGYQPKIWEDLTEVRSFSRELWDIATSQAKPLA